MAPLPSLRRSPPTMPLGCALGERALVVEGLRLGDGRLAQLLDSGSSASTLVAVGSRVLHRGGERGDDVVGLGAQALRRRRRRPSPSVVASRASSLAPGSIGVTAAALNGAPAWPPTSSTRTGGPGLLQRRLGEDLRRGVPGARDGEHLDARRRQLGVGLLRRRATRQRLGVGVGRLERRPDEGLAPWQLHRPAVASGDDVAAAPTAVAAVAGRRQGRGWGRRGAGRRRSYRCRRRASQHRRAQRQEHVDGSRRGAWKSLSSDTGDRPSTAGPRPTIRTQARVPNRRRASLEDISRTSRTRTGHARDPCQAGHADRASSICPDCLVRDGAPSERDGPSGSPVCRSPVRGAPALVDEPAARVEGAGPGVALDDPQRRVAVPDELVEEAVRDAGATGRRRQVDGIQLPLGGGVLVAAGAGAAEAGDATVGIDDDERAPGPVRRLGVRSRQLSAHRSSLSPAR